MSYWIVVAFIILASILRSSSGKGAKSAPQKGGGSGMDAEERQEIERRIREILGPQPGAGRVATSPSSPTASTASNKSVADRMQNSRRNIDTRQQSSKQRRELERKSAKTKKSAILDGDLTNQNVDFNSESIMSDFSIEKAVIYSEILEPKFKQY